MKDTKRHIDATPRHSHPGVAYSLRAVLLAVLAVVLCVGMCFPAFADVGGPGEKGTIVGDEGTIDDPERGYTDEEVIVKDGAATAKTEVGVFAKVDITVEDITPPSTGVFPWGRVSQAFSLVEKAYAADANYTDIWADIKTGNSAQYSWNVYLNGSFAQEMLGKTPVPAASDSSGVVRVPCPGTKEYVENNKDLLWGYIEADGYVELMWEILLYRGDDLVGYARTTTTFTDPADTGDYGNIDGTETNPDGSLKHPDWVYEEDVDGDGKTDVEITISGNIRKDAKLVVVPIDRMTGSSVWDAFQGKAGDRSIDRVYQILLVVRDGNGVVTQDKAYIGPVNVHVRYAKGSGFGEGASADMTDWQTWAYPTGALFAEDPTQTDQIEEKTVELDKDHPGFASIKTYKLGYFALLGKSAGSSGGGTHSVVVNVGAGGTVVGITGSSKTYTVADGGTLVLQANPNVGYVLSATSSTGAAPVKETSENAITIGPVTGNGVVDVSFSFVNKDDPNDPLHGQNHMVAAKVADVCKGMGTVAVGDQTAGEASAKQYVHGATDALVIFQPQGGYHVAGVTVNGKAVFVNGTSFAFPVVNEDKNVEVFFARGDGPIRGSWTVSVTTNPADAATVSGATTMPVGENGTFRIEANEGQTIGAATLDGVKLPKENLIYRGDGVWVATVPYNGSSSRALVIDFKAGEWPPDSGIGPFDPDNPNGSGDPNNPDDPNNPNNPGVDPADGPFIVDVTINGENAGYVYVVLQNENGMIEDLLDLNAPESQSGTVVPQSAENASVSEQGLLTATAQIQRDATSYAARPSEMLAASKQLRITPGSTAKFVLLPVYGNHISGAVKNGISAGVGDTHVLTHTSSADRHQTLEVTFARGLVSDPSLNDILTNGTSGNGTGSGSGLLSGVKTPTVIGSGLSKTGDVMGIVTLVLIGIAAVAVVVLLLVRRKSRESKQVLTVDATKINQMKGDA